MSRPQKPRLKLPFAGCDSQALNMLADLALSATSSTPSPELQKPPLLPELPQNSVPLSKEQPLCGTSDHEYHRGVKSQRGGPLHKPSSDQSSPSSDPTVSPEEESMGPGSWAPCRSPASTSPRRPTRVPMQARALCGCGAFLRLLLVGTFKEGEPRPGLCQEQHQRPHIGTLWGR